MRRALRILGWIVATVLLVPVLAVAALLLFANTDAGQAAVARAIPGLTRGMVQVEGLSGVLPWRIRIARLAVRDADGAWMTAEDAALDWDPPAVLRREAHVIALTASRLAVERLPHSAGGGGTGGAHSPPVRVVLDRLHVGALEIGAPLAGQRAELEADGSAALDGTLDGGSVTLRLTRRDSPGTYRAAARIAASLLHADVALDEPAGGLLGRLAGLPDLGALHSTLRLDGPPTAAALALALQAGPLQARAEGTVDTSGRSGDLAVTAHAPAMAPAPGLSWASVDVDGRLRGGLATLAGTARLRIAGLEAGGAGVQEIAADLEADAGAAKLTGTASGIRIPGPRPDLLGAAPARLEVTARLDQPDRPAHLVLSHKLLVADATVRTAGTQSGQADITLPDLAPLAAAGGLELAGHATLHVAGDAGQATLDARLGISGGQAPIPALLGPDARLQAEARLGDAITLTRLALDGRALTVAASGPVSPTIGLDWKVALADLAILAPTVAGSLRAEGHAQGAPEDLALHATAEGTVAAAGQPSGPVRVTLDATGLPARPNARIAAEGTLAGAPLRLQAEAARDPDGTLRATIAQASWKRTQASGALTLPPGAALPLGRLTVQSQAEDFSPFAGTPLRGALAAELDSGRDSARLHATLHGLAASGAAVGEAKLDATVHDPLGRPALDASLSATGIDAGGMRGNANLTAKGPAEALALRLNAALSGIAAQATATLDATARRLALTALTAATRGETVRLLAPARIDFAEGVSVDRLRLGLRGAEAEVAGRLSPRLDATVALRNLTADLARIAVPDLKLEGRAQAEAKLAGTPARPTGTVRLTATGLRSTAAGAAGMPAAALEATARLEGEAARIDATLTAGRNRLTVNGRAPLGTAGALDLRAAGNLDLATLDPILTAAGRRARGRVTLDAAVTGTPTAPRIAGNARLAGGELQDFAQGLRIDDIEARVEAAGDTVRLASLTGKAGGGTLSATGSLGLAAPMPIDLSVTLRQAAPLASDRLSATLDGDLTLRGSVDDGMTVGGRLTVARAEIRIPERLPRTVAVLNVRRPGQKPPPPAAPPPELGLDLTVTSPGRIFIRGRGVDAELSGTLRLRGTAAAPQPDGKFVLRRGTFSMAGQTLTFTSGEVWFDGSGKLDPAISLKAVDTSGGVTATLAIAGYASAPRIELSSVPELPQDEVLAHLLFHQSASQLGPFQLASIAQALADIAGVGGGFDPLGAVRSGLGLDRLSVSGGADGKGAAMEAGRYVAPGVYVGARQSTSGQGTQGVVQVDITRGLKLEGTVGTDSGKSATGSSSSGGSSVGLTYQFEY